MAIVGITPYLLLHGKAEQALEFYRRTLGGEIELITRFGDVMESCPVAMRDHVMHGQLRVGDARLMLSDGVEEAKPGGNVVVALGFDDPATMRTCFAALAEGGEVREPIIEAPFGLFGALTDRYGIAWMFSCQPTHA